MFQPRWVDLAKVYYTLEAMGEDTKLSPEVFTAIHGKGLALWEPAKFFDWAASKGLDRKKVEDLYNSFAMSGRINRAKQLAQAYNIQEVPTDHRRRQVHHQPGAGGIACGDAGGHERTGRQGARGAAEVLTRRRTRRRPA